MEDLKRLTINLALFSTDQPSNSVQKSSRSFDRSDLVGLGIVAAMSTCTAADPETASSKTHHLRAAKVLSVSVTKPTIGASKSIPINSSSPSGSALRLGLVGERVEDEMMMESYTCVISRIGNDRVTERQYFDNRVLADSKAGGVVTRGVFSRSLVEVVATEETPFWKGVDFLSSCFLCRKDLRGIDIFMYRGEKAFCSVECRDVQIATDKLKEKRGHVRVRTMEHPESPCCSPMLSYTGVVAA